MAFSLLIQRFCYCCTLRTGTLITGTLGLVGSMIQLCMIPVRMQLEPDDDEFENSGNRLISKYVIAHIGAVLISILVSVLLVVGVYKKNNKFMRPWLVLHCIGLTVISILCFICFGAIFFVDRNHTGLVFGLAIVLFLLGSVAWYCWICVWSYYMELKDRDVNVPYSPIHVSPPAHSKAVVY